MSPSDSVPPCSCSVRLDSYHCSTEGFPTFMQIKTDE